ncbi:AbrB/MazE/SpoVT family DNA-binding domain-containing protein [Bradyrhizobium sp. NBAIM03]|nr:AbrB/MazE/SpoVT family DNA-binding domain-containing protein [Bradyrhizobium sp. NBAIM03]MCA1551127.1 AbrB/MazE/SpoVT family DNA-binding domain-containing protein [Bradyrhizobium sp. BRP19]
MLVSKWGNSLAVRLPKALVDELGLKEGDEIDIVATRKGAIEIETKAEQRRRAIENMEAPLGGLARRLQIRSGRGERAVIAFFDSGDSGTFSAAAASAGSPSSIRSSAWLRERSHHRKVRILARLP